MVVQNGPCLTVMLGMKAAVAVKYRVSGSWERQAGDERSLANASSARLAAPDLGAAPGDIPAALIADGPLDRTVKPS